VENSFFGPVFEWDLAIQKPDTNCVRKMAIRNPDDPVFEWSMYIVKTTVTCLLQLFYDAVERKVAAHFFQETKIFTKNTFLL
jgi:hypothetical protein